MELWITKLPNKFLGIVEVLEKINFVKIGKNNILWGQETIWELYKGKA